MAKAVCIDVSEWQKNVNYQKVKNDGITSVIIRAGYGREESQKDGEFEKHYKNARAVGLNIGVYWYSYADSVNDAKREAKACIACLKGKKLNMPVYFDMEENAQTKYGKKTLTDMATAFCEEIKAAGFNAGVYSNPNWFKNYLDYNKLKSKYSIWLAQYNYKNDLDCDIWQNRSDGKINGINGNVDTNIIYNNSIVQAAESAVNAGLTDSQTAKKAESSIPDITYMVRCNGKWLAAVKNYGGYAGVRGKAITDVAIKASKGLVKYRVHVLGGGWLPYVTGCNTNDRINGYAGNGKAIDAVEIYYSTPKEIVKSRGYLRAKYRVSPVNSGYYSSQYDNEKTNGQDGYAGAFGKAIDRLQITLSK